MSNDPLSDMPFAVDEGESLEKILAQLLTTENIEMKTEIPNPINLVRLSMYGDWLKSNGKINASLMVESFVKKYLLYMVSHERKRSREIVEAISQLKDKDRSVMDKLTTPP
jgi:hypothetical protein